MVTDSNRTGILSLVSTGLLLIGLSAQHLGANPTGSPRPNIVLILVDDLGFGDLSCNGAPDLRTPHIDGLMSAGMRFNNFYANSPVCSPTRAALLTGKYPDLVGVPGVIRTHQDDNWGALCPTAVMLPSAVQQADYHTALIGKWHLGLESPSLPNERGFDFFRGFLGDMMDDYYDHQRFGRNYMRLNRKSINPQGHATDLFTSWATDYIEDRVGRKRPFFLYLAYNAPHSPVQPPAEWLERVNRREKQLTATRAQLVAFIEHLDDGIGKVVAALNRHDLYENTLIIFCSDNGGQLDLGANNGPYRGGKQDMYEGGIRVPMCAVWPNQINANSQSETVAVTLDLYPTLCDVARAKITHAINGQSLLSELLGANRAAEKRLLFWVRREGNRYGGQDYYAARYGQWKLLQNTPFEPLRLYNLNTDPQEQSPVDSTHEMYGFLFKALRGHVSQAGTVPWQLPPG